MQPLHEEVDDLIAAAFPEQRPRNSQRKGIIAHKPMAAEDPNRDAGRVDPEGYIRHRRTTRAQNRHLVASPEQGGANALRFDLGPS